MSFEETVMMRLSRIFKNFRLSGIALLLATLLLPFQVLAEGYIADDDIVIDLEHNLEWRRCSLGQTWDGEACMGAVGRFSLDQAMAALEALNVESQQGWRMPSHAELASLVCSSCDIPKIDARAFPDTSPEPYWSSDKNFFDKRKNWSVSFYTGHSFNRFSSEKELAVRPVRDR
jgi:hypothetical protein